MNGSYCSFVQNKLPPFTQPPLVVFLYLNTSLFTPVNFTVSTIVVADLLNKNKSATAHLQVSFTSMHILAYLYVRPFVLLSSDTITFPLLFPHTSPTSYSINTFEHSRMPFDPYTHFPSPIPTLYRGTSFPHATVKLLLICDAWR